MTQDHQADDEQIRRIAYYLAQALTEMQRSAADQPGADSMRQEIASARLALEDVAGRLERQLTEEKEQRLVLASQLSGLAGSLDQLVSHLAGLSQLMVDILDRVEAPGATPAQSEPSFTPGGEGVSLVLTAVPGFQALMDIQKALMALDQVTGVSVERFQEGDSRLLVHLSAAITGPALVQALQNATGYSIATEESRPELSRLRLKIVPGS